MLYEDLSAVERSVFGDGHYKSLMSGRNYIFDNLNSRVNLREYQLEAIGRYLYYMEDYKSMSESGTTETSIGYVDNTIYHLYHGPSVSRQYGSRHDDLWRFLRSKKITRLSDLVERREDGIFEWIPTYRDECNALLLKYFYARNDDS
jgi:hypothetical protein